VNLPPLTKKDIADVALAAQLDVDFVALSFVREKSDIEQLRQLLSRKKSNAQIVAKIEDQLAVRSIEKMIESADVIMVARGDLGIECPMEELPIIQRRIVKKCIRLGKPVVIATQLLESMITNRLPTRAEVTDVANAVFEQADALMLTAETTLGRYPIECVEVLNRVAIRIERSGGAGYAKDAMLESVRQKTAASAVALANSLQDSKLIVFTRHGRMARYTSNLRPQRTPIFAFTPSEQVYRRLALYWGVFPIRIDFTPDPDKTIASAEKFLRGKKLAAHGNRMVIISDVHMGRAMIDSIQLRVVK
jgi:pyruvate kinase